MSEQQATEAAPPTTNPDENSGENQSQSRSAELESLLAQMSNPPAADDEVAETEEFDEQQEEQPEEEVSEEVGDTATNEEPPTEEEEEPVVNKDAKNIRGRIDHLTDKDKDVVFLVTKRGYSLEDARKAIYGDNQPQAKEAAPDPVVTVDQQISAAEAKIAELDAQIEEAAFEPDKQKELRQQLKAEERKLGRLEAEKENAVKQRETQSKQAEQDATATAFEKTLSDYPDAFAEKEKGSRQFDFNPESALGQAAAAEYEYLEGTQSPLLKNPRCLEIILKRVSVQIGYKKPASSSLTVVKEGKPSAKETPPKRGVRPVATGGTQPPEVSAQAEIEKAIQSGNKSDILAALQKHGSSF